VPLFLSAHLPFIIYLSHYFEVIPSCFFAIIDFTEGMRGIGKLRCIAMLKRKGVINTQAILYSAALTFLSSG